MKHMTDHYEKEIKDLRLASKEIDFVIRHLIAKGVESKILELALTLRMLEFSKKNQQARESEDITV